MDIMGRFVSISTLHSYVHLVSGSQKWVITSKQNLAHFSVTNWNKITYKIGCMTPWSRADHIWIMRLCRPIFCLRGRLEINHFRWCYVRAPISLIGSMHSWCCCSSVEIWIFGIVPFLAWNIICMYIISLTVLGIVTYICTGFQC